MTGIKTSQKSNIKPILQDKSNKLIRRERTKINKSEGGRKEGWKKGKKQNEVKMTKKEEREGKEREGEKAGKE